MIPQPDRRIAAVLVRSAGVQDEPTVRASQTELGRLANASRKLVNKALHQFAAAGWIVQHYGAIQIHNVQALSNFAARRGS
jgi:hypothetical protein